jgi:hypothetical protein
MGGDTAADSHTTGSGETHAPEPYGLADVPGPLSVEELRRLAWGTLGYFTATAFTTGWSTSTVRSSILARSSGILARSSAR